MSTLSLRYLIKHATASTRCLWMHVCCACFMYVVLIRIRLNEADSGVISKKWNKLMLLTKLMLCLRIKPLAVKVPPSCRYLDLFSVVPSSTPRPRCINNQLASLAPVEIINCMWYTCSWNISLFIINYSNRIFILSYYYHYVVSRNAPSSKQVLFTILERDKLMTTVAVSNSMRNCVKRCCVSRLQGAWNEAITW